MKLTTYIRKDGTTVVKKGRWRVLEIDKRPHGGYCCMVIEKRFLIKMEGFHGTSLPTLPSAKKWGISKAKELGII